MQFLRLSAPGGATPGAPDKGNTGTFRGVGNNVGFTFLLQPSMTETTEAMSLPAFADFHTEGAPFIGQRIGIHDFARRPGQLEVVLIINNDQIIQP